MSRLFAPSAASTRVFVLGALLCAGVATVVPGSAAAYQLGDVVNDFTYDNLAGEPVSLSDFAGDIVLINFFATWCPGCNVEAAILEHPAVREVAVVGLPDDDLGERIVAFVVAREPVEADALVERVATELTPHKRPREVRFVDALPRNAMGKVMKRQLHEP